VEGSRPEKEHGGGSKRGKRFDSFEMYVAKTYKRKKGDMRGPVDICRDDECNKTYERKAEARTPNHRCKFIATSGEKVSRIGSALTGSGGHLQRY